MCGIVLVLGGPWSGARAASAEEVNPYIPKAEQLFDNLKYRQALKMLEKAAKWPANTPEQNVSIALLEGVLHCEIGIIEQNAEETQRCKEAFGRALAIDPKAQLSFPVSPKIAEQLEQERPRPPVVVPPPITNDPRIAERPNVTKTETPTATGLGANLAQYRMPMAMVGGGVALAGALSWVRAKSLDHQVRTADTSITTRAQLDGTLRDGKTFETVGWVLLGTGAATALGSLLLPDSSRSEPTPVPAVMGAPMKGGAHLGLHWSLP